MSIVSSTYVAEPREQADGATWVNEYHTDNLGNVYRVTYKATPTMDKQAIMEARAVKLSEELADREAEEITNG